MTEHGDFAEFLTDRDRILMAAWMLPNEGPLTEIQRKEALANFVEYCERVNLLPHQVGRMVGTPSGGTIHALVQGKWNSESDRHVRILNQWVEQHARKESVKLKGKLVNTKVAKDIQAVAELVRQNGTMGMLWGPTGIGKSRCAEALFATIAGSLLITIADDCRSASGLRRVLLNKTGGRGASLPAQLAKRSMAVFEHIVDRLKDSGRLIIIDESHKMRDGAIELLREIHDATKCPVLCLGTKEFFDRIERNADPDGGQIYSRFDFRWSLTQGAGNDSSRGKRLFTVQDIRDLYEITPIRLSKDAVNYLQDVANQLGFGSLRRCGILLINAARRARKRQQVEDGADVTVTSDDLAFVEGRFCPDPMQQEEAKQRRARAVAAG